MLQMIISVYFSERQEWPVLSNCTIVQKQRAIQVADLYSAIKMDQCRKYGE